MIELNREVSSYLERIEDLRGQVIDLVKDLPAETLNWRPVEGEDDHVTNSMAVMAAHVAGAEHFWIAEVIGNRPATRVRDEEFQIETSESQLLVAKLEETGRETRAILSGLSTVDLDGTREARGRTVPVRWGILHVIDHTALHLGHMQITFQLWQGGQGIDAPRWFQRLSSDK